MSWLKRIFAVLIVAVATLTFSVPGNCASSNVPLPDIGDDGTWATANNREMFVGQMTRDIEQFQGNFQTQVVDDFVPIEAKIGLTFMNALSFVSDVLDSSLVRFVVLFMFIAFAFWVMFETYNMMQGGKGNTMDLIKNIVKKGTMIAIWVVVLRFGPAQIFMWIMGPIISVGTYLSDFILDAVAASAGAQLPDTCAAIREYAAANISEKNIIDATAAADMMCLPTRMTGFCYTAIAAGFKWMISGLGTSAFTFLGGLLFVVLFIMIAWKFMFMALGIIADLFLGVMMLPFTAIKETVASTSYKGIAGNIFNSFLGIFSTESLESQITRFIQAAIYFVSLSIVVAFCVAMLSGVIDADIAARVPRLENDGFWATLLVGALTWWFANQAMDLAKKLGGNINASFGDQVRGDIKKLWDNTSGTAKKWWKIIREKK